MQESNIVLIDFPQADGGSKVRPALILKHLPETSIIRLFFLAVVFAENISRSIGEMPHNLHKKLLERLAMFLTS